MRKWILVSIVIQKFCFFETLSVFAETSENFKPTGTLYVSSYVCFHQNLNHNEPRIEFPGDKLIIGYRLQLTKNLLLNIGTDNGNRRPNGDESAYYFKTYLKPALGSYQYSLRTFFLV